MDLAALEYLYTCWSAANNVTFCARNKKKKPRLPVSPAS
jgi:hypothetical protein